MDLTEYVDPFHGNGAIDLPAPRGIAASWFFLKAQTGNTHPGACSPFGMVSASAYSGAYPSGYGLNAPNTHGTVPLRFRDYSASGFTHFHHSGTGMIRTYYNYLRVTPICGGLDRIGVRWSLEKEVARPGYYAATLAGTGITAELAVSGKAALHRYTFSGNGEAQVAVDFSSGGLDFPGMDTYPAEASVEVVSPRAAQGHVLMEGMRLYVYVEAEGVVETCSLWTGVDEARDRSRLSMGPDSLRERKPFGVLFRVPSGVGARVTLRVGFSLRRVEPARRNAWENGDGSFDDVAEATRRRWDQYLSRIIVEGGGEERRRVFYSSLYHSLLKPADFSGESPFWGHGGAFYLDFATMWDQYKTQLPLMLTVYGEHGADAVNSTLDLADHRGRFANCVMLDSDFSRTSNQARSLAHYMITDAFHRKLEGIDWQRAKDLMVADILSPGNRDFLENGLAQPITHTLDLAGASWCVAWIARALGDSDTLRRMGELAGHWRNAYDPATGRLPDGGSYYEGGPWNYSFRLLHDMAGRIALYGSEADFIADLDAFFGYGQPAVVQPTAPDDTQYMDWGRSLNRFEGFNNEPDIESPYDYLYAGRHDRTAEVVRAGMRYMFTTGRGGLPGNDDSGGLSSCYVWNAIGLFPVTGQPVMLIGSPVFDAVTISLGERTFKVEAENNSDENIYVQTARLNGEEIDRAYLSVDELVSGGVLTLKMGPQPGKWARGSRPPSFPLL